MFYIRMYALLSGLLFSSLISFSQVNNLAQAKFNDTATFQPGVVLTLDDHSVAEWVRADSLFGGQDKWKATFFVSHFNKLTAGQRRMLLQLQANGHEIGFHGDAHVSAVPFIQGHSIQAYLDSEFTQLEPMRSMGLNVHTFAYPSGSRNAATDSALLKIFSTLRGVTNKEAASKNYKCFFNGNMLVDGIGIEFQYKYFSHDYLQSLLDYAKQHNKILVLYGHKPMTNAAKDKHEVDYSTIKFICDYVNNNQMKFYTMSDLANIK